MVGRQIGRLAARLARVAEPATARAKATDLAQRIRDEYRRGLQGETTTATDGPTDATADDAAVTDDEVGSVADALRGVDWAKVRAATAERTSGAASTMRSLAADVDWGKVQAGAAVVSSALIAAVASGQIPVGGRLAGPVARAILDDAQLAQRVSSTLAARGAAVPDFRGDVSDAAPPQSS
ncbi:MAG: hypothetical protein ACKOA2_10615 [Ilumatobacteraceae bacterium]